MYIADTLLSLNKTIQPKHCERQPVQVGFFLLSSFSLLTESRRRAYSFSNLMTTWSKPQPYYAHGRGWIDFISI